MENNEKKVQLGDGVWDNAKTEINAESTKLITKLINVVFGYIGQKIDKLPEAIQQMENRPETTQEIMKMWSDSLSEQGLISGGYAGLPDELLIHNFHQDGYLAGLYAGYALALVAMADNAVQKESIIAVRDAMRPNLLGHSYEERSEFTGLLKDEKYEWINKEK